jgi:hypothetical protein
VLRVGVAAQLVAQLAHRQPGLWIGRQALRRGQRFQQLPGLGLVARAQQHLAELAPGVLVMAADEDLQLTPRLGGVAAVQRELGARLRHRRGLRAQRLPAVQRTCGSRVIVRRDRQHRGTFGHRGIVAERHRLAVMQGGGLQVAVAQRHLAGQQLREQVVILVRRHHRHPCQRLRGGRRRFGGRLQRRLGTAGQSEHQRRGCRKMPHLLESATPASHTDHRLSVRLPNTPRPCPYPRRLDDKLSLRRLISAGTLVTSCR